MANETATLARYVANLRYADLPIEVPARAKLLALDFIGSIVRAGRDADSTPALQAAVRTLGLDVTGPSAIFGEARRRAAPVAALINGMLGHSLDFDDTHADSSLHPSAPVVPAAFAVGELLGASGSAVLAAIVAGYEVCCRLGNALDPARHYARGFHPTATAGVFGAAAAAGNLLGLDSRAMEAAFGIAGSQAAGSLQFLENGAWNKRYQVGAAAMNGVLAATLAHHGFHGAAEAIEGKHGFLAGYTDGARPGLAIAGLGDAYETRNIGYKPYPSCRYTHAALDGLIALRTEGNLEAEAFRSVVIGLHGNGMRMTAEPIGEKRRPKNIVDGQFSMPFTAAAVIDAGRFGWDDYARLHDPKLAAIAQRVEVRRDPRVEDRSHPFGATLRVELPSATVERLIPDPSGEPSLFPSDAQVRAKFLSLAEPVVGAAAHRFAEAFEALDEVVDVRTIASLLTAQADAASVQRRRHPAAATQEVALSSP